MESCSDISTVTTALSSSSSPSPPRFLSPSSSPPLPSSPPPRPPQPRSHNQANIVVTPCAACKILRRRCAEKCVLAPYFPPTDPLKFTTAHRVFGASNIIKFLQELPECQREDAVSSMVYEANARLRDPVYGCAGAICHLQEQVNELQAQLAKTHAELVNMQHQQSNLVGLICMEMAPQSPQDQSSQQQSLPLDHNFMMIHSPPSFIDDNNLGGSTLWEPLWT